MRSELRTALLLAALSAAVPGCGEEPDERRGDGRLVWASGRDDHGFLEVEDVRLYDAVDGRQISSVPDGTLLAVLDRDGVWLEVRTIVGDRAQGWVDDFRLRGQLRLVGDDAPDCASVIGSTSVPGGTLVTVWQLRGSQVLVETVAEPNVRGLAPLEDLQELPPQGEDCGSDPPGQRHQH